MPVIPSLLLLVVLGGGNGLIRAQQPPQPLTLEISGDYWVASAVQSPLIRRTNWGYNKEPILSPKGKLVAYKSTAKLAVDASKGNNASAGGDWPANIWVIDTTNGNSQQVAKQPRDAAYQKVGTPNKYVIRSDPTWSPDATALAWTELQVSGDKAPGDIGQQLVVFDMSHAADPNYAGAVIVPNLPARPGADAGLEVRWGAAGLAVWTITGGTDANGNFTAQDALSVYAPDGKLITTKKIDTLSEFAWVHDGDRDYVGMLSKGSADAPSKDLQWLLLDPRNGTLNGMPGVPEMYSLTAPDGLTVFPASMGTSPDWQIVGLQHPVVKLGNLDDVYAFSHVLGISADGQQVAYVKQGAAYVYNNGSTIKIAPSDTYALVWGPTGWRVHRGQ